MVRKVWHSKESSSLTQPCPWQVMQTLCKHSTRIESFSGSAVLPATARFLVFKLAYTTSPAAYDWSAADVESVRSTSARVWWSRCHVQCSLKVPRRLLYTWHFYCLDEARENKYRLMWDRMFMKVDLPLLQRVSIACYAERCISHSKSVRLSVRLTVCHTLAKRLKLRSWGLHWRIAPWF